MRRGRPSKKQKQQDVDEFDTSKTAILEQTPEENENEIHADGVVFTDDPSVKIDFYEIYSTGHNEVISEKKLWRQVLIESIHDYQTLMNIPKGKSRFGESFDWFFNEHELDHIGSFENVCSILNIDPSFIRKCLIKWTKQNVKEPEIVKGPPVIPELTLVPLELIKIRGIQYAYNGGGDYHGKNKSYKIN
jgi:hypothetical protein